MLQWQWSFHGRTQYFWLHQSSSRPSFGGLSWRSGLTCSVRSRRPLCVRYGARLQAPRLRAEVLGPEAAAASPTGRGHLPARVLHATGGGRCCSHLLCEGAFDDVEVEVDGVPLSCRGRPPAIEHGPDGPCEYVATSVRPCEYVATSTPCSRVYYALEESEVRFLQPPEPAANVPRRG